MKSADEQLRREKAWLGDAALALYARQWILAQRDIPAGERSDTFIRMTSNEFLASVGEPTQMEAEIGIIYEKEGLDAAFAYIESRFLPVFKKQRANKRNPRTHARKRKKA